MAIRTILVPLSGGESDVGPLDAVMQIAKRLDTHVEALHIVEDPERSLAYIGEGMTPTMINDVIKTAEEREAARTKQAHDQFNAACAKHEIPIADSANDAKGVSARLIEVTGFAENEVANRGRLTDLVAICRPIPDAEGDFATVIEPALMDTGCPVLVVPPGEPVVHLKKAAIAWNGGPEAARAIRSALPLLAAMDEVAVIEIDEERQPGPPLGDVLRYLSWHGVTATSVNVARDGRAVEDALLDTVKDEGADLLVMGAHTRNRLRRMIFGDVTGEVLATAPVVAFMMH